MAKLKLTDKRLEKLTTSKAQEDFWDTLTPGLCVRVSGKTGKKTWFVRYRQNGTHRRMKLGVYDRLGLAAAREEARNVLADADAGEDPAKKRAEIERCSSGERDDTTFGAQAKRVLAEWADVKDLRPATVKERDRVLDKILIPAWGDRAPDEITRSDVNALRRSLADTPTQANRVVSIVSLIFNLFMEEDPPLVEATPVGRVHKLSEGERDRWLDRDEIRAAWHLFDDMGLVPGGALKMALLTAQRIGSIRAMRWDQIRGSTWRIPSENFKGRREHWVPVSRATKELLKTLKPVDSEWVFPALRADSKTGHIGQVDSALYRAVRKTDMEPFRAHDLRETFYTWVTRAAKSPDPDIPAGCGIGPEAASAVLGHKEHSTANKHYHGAPAEFRLAEKREALEAWGEFVMAAVKERKMRVVA